MFYKDSEKQIKSRAGAFDRFLQEKYNQQLIDLYREQKAAKPSQGAQ